MKYRLNDAHTAGRLRDVIRRIAVKEVDKAVPHDSFGRVIGVDEDTRIATFIPTSGTLDPQTAPFAAGTPPDVGDVVRVTGRAGARHIIGNGLVIGIPPGGDELMFLAKFSDEDYDVGWVGASATGASAGAFFPIGPYDDGTGTHEIFTTFYPGFFGEESDTVYLLTHDASGAVSQSVQGVSDASGVGIAINQIGAFETTPANGYPTATGTPGATVTAFALAGVGNQVAVRADDGEGDGAQVLVKMDMLSGLGIIQIGGDGTATTTIELGFSGDIIMLDNLPLSPGISGSAWNDAGTVKVSP